MKAACDETQPTFHAGYAMSTRYAQHMCNLLHEVVMVNTFQCRNLKEYGQQNAELKKANRELTKGVKLLAGELCDYECLQRESESENYHLWALVETAHEDEKYAKKYSQFLEKELAERDGELLGKDAHIRARDIELGNKDIAIA
jgi:hypothetical protein